MFDKIGIIIKDEEAPKVSSREMNSILKSLETKAIDTIICDNILDAKKLVQEKYEEISFVYIISPIPTIEKPIYNFLEFITKNEAYKHIKFFARIPQGKLESKYKWDDDFINYVKL